MSEWRERGGGGKGQGMIEAREGAVPKPQTPYPFLPPPSSPSCSTRPLYSGRAALRLPGILREAPVVRLHVHHTERHAAGAVQSQAVRCR